MIKFIILISFVVGAFYNYILSKYNIISIKKRPIFIILLILFGILGTFLCYKLDHTILGYIIVISAILFFYSFTFFPGITKEGINVFLGGITFIKHIKANEIDNLEYREKNSEDFELIIKAYGNTFTQIYHMKDRDRILKLLSALKLV